MTDWIDPFWASYLDSPPDPSRYLPGTKVVDVGCGEGSQLDRLGAAGLRPIGVEPSRGSARAARRSGHPVVVAKAEALPFRKGSIGGVLCRVVLPYTDERESIAEIGRILTKGGTAIVSYHGIGYSLRYLMRLTQWRSVAYALKTFLNTLVYRTTGRRLPGALGDTLFQSRRRMLRYYRDSCLRLEEQIPAPTFLKQPVFVGHVLRR